MVDEYDYIRQNPDIKEYARKINTIQSKIKKLERKIQNFRDLNVSDTRQKSERIPDHTHKGQISSAVSSAVSNAVQLTSSGQFDDVGDVIPATGDEFLIEDASDSQNKKSVTFDALEGAISHDNISGVSTSDHHTKYTDAEAVDAIEAIGAGVAVLADTIPFIDATDSTLKQESLTDINALLDHGNLAGLGDDDHTQYLLVDGTRALTGTLDMGAQSIDDLADVTFQTGAVGGTLRTGTADADKFALQAYDVDGATYVNVIQANAGNTVTMDLLSTATIGGVQIASTDDLHTKYTDAEAVDAIEAVGVAVPIATDEIIFSDGGVLKKVDFDDVDETVLTAIKSYIDGQTHEADTNLTDEEVQDIVGGMVSTNTETRISVTYDDPNGKLNFVADDQTAHAHSTLTGVGTSDHHAKYTDTEAVDAIEAVTDLAASPASTDHVIFNDAGVLKQTAFSDLDETTLSAIKTYVDGQTHEADTNLTQEEVEDYVGGMLNGTETRISVTYDDINGNIDFVVDDPGDHFAEGITQHTETLPAPLCLATINNSNIEATNAGVYYKSTGGASIFFAINVPDWLRKYCNQHSKTLEFDAITLYWNNAGTSSSYIDQFFIYEYPLDSGSTIFLNDDTSHADTGFSNQRYNPPDRIITDLETLMVLVKINNDSVNDIRITGFRVEYDIV